MAPNRWTRQEKWTVYEKNKIVMSRGGVVGGEATVHSFSYYTMVTYSNANQI